MRARVCVRVRACVCLCVRARARERAITVLVGALSFGLKLYFKLISSTCNIQACPWDIFFCPIPSHSIAVHGCPIPSHGIPIKIQFYKSY